MDQTQVGEYLVVNQGTIRLCRFMEQRKSRIRVTWANSVRTMVRDVNVVYTLIGWLERPNSRVIPLKSGYDPLRAYIDQRLSKVEQELVKLSQMELDGKWER